MLSTWIKGITGHNNLAYFQSKLNYEIDPTCRLCLQANKTLHHLMTDCEVTSATARHYEKQNSTTGYIMVCKRNKQLYATSSNTFTHDI